MKLIQMIKDGYFYFFHIIDFSLYNGTFFYNSFTILQFVMLKKRTGQRSVILP